MMLQGYFRKLVRELIFLWVITLIFLIGTFMVLWSTLVGR